MPKVVEPLSAKSCVPKNCLQFQKYAELWVNLFHITLKKKSVWFQSYVSEWYTLHIGLQAKKPLKLGVLHSPQYRAERLRNWTFAHLRFLSRKNSGYLCNNSVWFPWHNVGQCCSAQWLSLCEHSLPPHHPQATSPATGTHSSPRLAGTELSHTHRSTYIKAKHLHLA